MAAVMSGMEPEIEPTGYGHELLEYWAACTRGGLPGSHGEWSVKERIDPVHDDAIPEKAIKIERIVADIGKKYPVYRRIIRHYWLGRESYWEIAGKLERTKGFIRMSVQAVADWVEREYETLDTPE